MTIEELFAYLSDAVNEYTVSLPSPLLIDARLPDEVLRCVRWDTSRLIESLSESILPVLNKGTRIRLLKVSKDEDSALIEIDNDHPTTL